MGDLFRWDDRRAVVVGGATGIGAAAGDLVTALGGSVTVLDVKEPTASHERFVAVDLRDATSIEDAVAALDAPVHAVFSCAGIAAGPDVVTVNFIGHRHLIEALVARDAMPSGSAIAMIASIGGLGWEQDLDVIGEFLATPDHASAVAWVSAHPDRADYGFAKQAMIVYCGRRALELQRRGIRINATAPGPVMTPLMAATPEWQGFEVMFRELAHREGSTPEEQAYPLVFLASPAASFINGECLLVDAGLIEAGTTGGLDHPAVDMLLHRAGDVR
jgi:NAD(P)-dependent dehydrogenase (short-subunit alcohol dehydrogenase family)